ncbi:MAG TPA: Mur ligase domain-containing protein, partial [Albitalea sp.]
MHELHSVREALDWLAARRVVGLTTDSRRATHGEAFIAWPGATTDARQYVGAALAAGATACIVEAEGVEAFRLAGDDRIAAL